MMLMGGKYWLMISTGISVHCIRTFVDQRLIQVNDRTAGGLLLFFESVIERLRFI